jgi:hypothetical protein
MAALRHANFGFRGLSPRQAPAVPSEIDWEHPLARGLGCFYAFGAHSGLRDLCGSIGVLTPAVGAGLSAGYYGTGWAATANDQYLTSAPVPAALKPTTGSGVSVLWAGTWISNATSYGGPMFGLCYDVGINSPYHVFNIQDASPTGNGPVDNNVTITYTAGGPIQEASSPAVAGPQVLVGTLPFVTPPATLYRNGAVIATQNNVGVPSYTATSMINVNGFGTPVTRTLNKITNAGAIWTRVLSPGEVAWISAEPFVVLRPIQRRRFYLPNTAVAAPAGKRPRITMIA